MNYQSAGALPLISVIHLLVCFRRERGVGALNKTARIDSPPPETSPLKGEEHAIGPFLFKAFGRFVFGGFAIAAGFAVVLAVAEAATYPMIMLFRSQGLTYPQATFFEVLWPRFTGQASVPLNAAGLVLFPYFMGLFHGWLGAAALAILICVGLLAAYRRFPDRRAVIALYCGVAFLVPFVLFSLKTMQGARTFTYALPFFAALTGVAVVSAWSVEGRWRTSLRGVVVAACAVFLGANGFALWEVRSIRSAYPEFIEFVRQQGDPRSSAAWSSTLRCYALDAGMEGGDLYRYLGQDETPPRWFVNDWQEFYGGRYPDEPIALDVGATPTHEFSHAFGRIFLEVEALPSHGDTFENLRWVRGLDLERSRRLLVYDLMESSLRQD